MLFKADNTQLRKMYCYECTALEYYTVKIMCDVLNIYIYFKLYYNIYLILSCTLHLYSKVKIVYCKITIVYCVMLA